MKSGLFTAIALTFVGITCIPFLAHAGVAVNTPFDGGLSLLAIAGIGYASKKAYDKRKKDKMKTDAEK